MNAEDTWLHPTFVERIGGDAAAALRTRIAGVAPPSDDEGPFSPADAWSWRVDNGVVCFEAPVSAPAPAELVASLKALMPWRKGPFRFDDLTIDAEWRSELKWDRLVRAGCDLRGALVCDVGCNNGYYMYRAAAAGAEWVFGVDPQALYGRQFAAMNALAPDPRLFFASLGESDLELVTGGFDRILLMGILYHHTDPIAVLRRCRRALAKGGCAVIETIVIPGEGSFAVFPEGRYAGARGFYFLPTLRCLLSWLRRAGYSKWDVGEVVRTDPDEQRATVWREGASLAEGLDPADPSRTVEGHPAPERVVILAWR